MHDDSVLQHSAQLHHFCQTVHALWIPGTPLVRLPHLYQPCFLAQQTRLIDCNHDRFKQIASRSPGWISVRSGCSGLHQRDRGVQSTCLEHAAWGYVLAVRGTK